MTRWLVACSVCLLLGCTAGSDEGDAGPDGSAIDAGVDGGAEDAGPDGGAPDAGLDGGLRDAGPDGGALDAGPDGGVGACVDTDRPLPNRGLTEVSFEPRCLDGMKLVDTFCVDAYEAFLVELLPGGGTAEWSPFFNPGARTMRAMSVAGAVPQGYIDADRAAAACQAASKRLCTDVEWLRACQGAAGDTYPYGSTRQDGACNDARSAHPAVEYFGSSDPSVFSMLDHSCLNQLVDSLARTGDHPACESADGLFDLMGNLHEWTADPAGTFRGGFYVDTRINGEGCLYRTTAHSRPYWDYSTGFRCCADAAP